MKKITKISILISTISTVVISIPIAIHNSTIKNNNSQNSFYNYSTYYTNRKNLRDINIFDEKNKIFKEADLIKQITDTLADPKNKVLLNKNYINDELEATNELLGLDPKYITVIPYQKLHNGSNKIKISLKSTATFEDLSQLKELTINIKDRFFEMIDSPKYNRELFNDSNTPINLTNQLLGINENFDVASNTTVKWGDNLIWLIAKKGFIFSNRKHCLHVNIQVFKNKLEDIKKNIEDIKKQFDNIQIINQSFSFTSDIVYQFNMAFSMSEKLKLFKKWFGLDISTQLNDTKITNIIGTSKDTGAIILTFYTYSTSTPASIANNNFDISIMGSSNKSIADLIQTSDKLKFESYFHNAFITADAQGYRLIGDIAKTIVDADSLYLLLGQKNVPKLTGSFLKNVTATVNVSNNNLKITVNMTTPFATVPLNIFICDFKPNKLDSDILDIPTSKIKEGKNIDIENINHYLQNLDHKNIKLVSDNINLMNKVTNVSTLKTWTGIDLNIPLKSTIINKVKSSVNIEGDLIVNIYLKTNKETSSTPNITKVFKKVFEKSIVIGGKSLSLKWIIVISVFGGFIVCIGIALLLFRRYRF